MSNTPDINAILRALADDARAIPGAVNPGHAARQVAEKLERLATDGAR